MGRGIRIALILALVLIFTPLSVAADGPLKPHEFYGTVKCVVTEGGPLVDAPEGVLVIAKVDGVEKGRIEVNPAGQYGGPLIPDGKLVVQDVAGEGNLIEFWIGPCKAEQTYEYDSGATTELDLTTQCICAPTPTPTSPPGNGAETEETPTPTVPPEETPTPTVPPEETPTVTPTPPPPPFELNVSYLWDGVTSGGMTEEGVLTETIAATSDDGMVTLTLAQGTQVLSCEDGLVDVIEVQQVETPPTAPPDHHVIAAYDFEPCCTFDPPITLTIRYDPADLPDGFSEGDLVIAYYDAGEWVLLDTDVNTAANTVTTDEINEFTVFAVLAAPAPPAGLGPAAWAGIAVLGLLLLVILGLIIWSLLRRRAPSAPPEATP